MSVLGVEGEVSPWIWGRLQPLLLPGREMQELHPEVCSGGCRGAPWALGGSEFWDGHPRDAKRCWAVGGSLVPAWLREEKSCPTVPGHRSATLICCLCGHGLV